MNDAKLVRWVKRCRDGKDIPPEAIRKYKLSRWFAFTEIGGETVALAEATGQKVDFATGEFVTDPDYVPPPGEHHG